MSDATAIGTTASPADGRPAGRRLATCVRALGACLTLVSGLALTSCGGSEAAEHDAAIVAARAALPSDPSAALFLARDAIDARPERGIENDGQLELIAAEACLSLNRHSEALAYATDGLTAADLDDALKGDLFWARGSALMERYIELSDEADWRAANSTLEKATESGNHRVEAAARLIALQDLGNHSNPERQLKYARLVIELDTEGKRAALVKRLLETKGLTP